MANGYVHPFMRAPFHQRFPQLQSAQRPPSTDPSALFSQDHGEAKCLFPNAFPEQGPNIIQRFWIRLFMFFIGTPYIFLRDQISSILNELGKSYTFMQALDRETLSKLDIRDLQILTQFFMENRWSIIIGLVVVVLCSLAAWFFSPKGENNTIWRSTLILSFASCYIMWAITFLAQLHPLIQPRMTKLREGYAGGS